jgi:hypothetical protein
MFELPIFLYFSKILLCKEYKTKRKIYLFIQNSNNTHLLFIFILTINKNNVTMLMAFEESAIKYDKER